jgi:GT2 family glycosyltransferase
LSDTLLIIPSYLGNNEHIAVLGNCIRSIRASTDAPLLIVDDGSPLSDDQKGMIYNDAIKEGYENVEVIQKEENEGFSSTVNTGLKVAIENKQNACLINADIEFREEGWLNELEGSDADIVGGLLLYPSLLIQHAGIYFSVISRNFSHRFSSCPPNLPAAHKECECPVTGALQFLRYSVIDDVGLYDDKFKMGFEDVDYMIRAIKSGHKSLYNPKVKAIHHESLFRKEGNEKVKQWETDSLAWLLKKYEGVHFDGVAPTKLEV